MAVLYHWEKLPRGARDALLVTWSSSLHPNPHSCFDLLFRTHGTESIQHRPLSHKLPLHGVAVCPFLTPTLKWPCGLDVGSEGTHPWCGWPLRCGQKKQNIWSKQLFNFLSLSIFNIFYFFCFSTHFLMNYVFVSSIFISGDLACWRSSSEVALCFPYLFVFFKVFFICHCIGNIRTFHHRKYFPEF